MVRTGVAILGFFVVGVSSCSVAYSQSLDFRIDGPTEVDEGDYVELRVEFPEGVQADVNFVPVEEDRFGVHPIVHETIVERKLVPVVTGRVCTFSARCRGERDVTVVATAFASFDGVPRIHSLRHRIRVKAVDSPKPPENLPPPPPRDDDDLGPLVPLPNATLSDADLGRVVRIVGDVVDRLEALERRESTPVRAAPTTASDRSDVSTAISDAKPGHWSVSSASNVWSPTKGEAIAHLRSSHAATAMHHEPLEALAIETILALHDDAHEGRTVSVTQPPVQRYVTPSANACPGGVCPTAPRSSYTTGPLGVIRWRR